MHFTVVQPPKPNSSVDGPPTAAAVNSSQHGTLTDSLCLSLPLNGLPTFSVLFL